MHFNPSNKDTVSVQIIKIAKLAVTLGMSMILIAVATGKGLQKEIQEKTVAFNGHLVVAPFENSESQISVLPIANDPKILKILKNEDGVTQVNKVALKGGSGSGEVLPRWENPTRAIPLRIQPPNPT